MMALLYGLQRLSPLEQRPAPVPEAAPSEEFGTLEPWGEFGPKDRMRARRAANVLRQGMMLFDKANVVRSALRGDTLSWRVERGPRGLTNTSVQMIVTKNNIVFAGINGYSYAIKYSSND